MKNDSLLERLFFAIGLTALAAAIVFISPLIAGGSGLILALFCATVIAVVTELRRVTGGRVTLGLTAVLLMGGAGVFLGWWPLVLVGVGCIWAARSLARYARPRWALVDLVLSLGSLFVALAAAAHTRSMLMGIWCFFLMQSLCVLIPGARKIEKRSDDFDSALRTAEEALHAAFR